MIFFQVNRFSNRYQTFFPKLFKCIYRLLNWSKNGLELSTTRAHFSANEVNLNPLSTPLTRKLTTYCRFNELMELPGDYKPAGLSYNEITFYGRKHTKIICRARKNSFCSCVDLLSYNPHRRFIKQVQFLPKHNLKALISS